MEQQFHLDKLLDTYSNLVAPQYKKALQDLMENGAAFRPPSLNIEEASLVEAAEHVQNCSEYHSDICKLAGFAKSAYNLSEGLYKQRFRQALGKAPGSNKESREAYAAGETEEENAQVLFYESAMILFDSLEKSARGAADSSRKMAELIKSQNISEVGNGKYS